MGKKEEIDISPKEAIRAVVAGLFVVGSCLGRGIPSDEDIDKGFEQADKFVASIKFK